MTWEELQALFADQTQGISSQSITNANLQLYMKLKLGKITSYYDWSFAIRTGTVATSSTSPVDLKTELPDIKRPITFTGSSGDQPYEWELIPSRDYQLTSDGDGDYMDPRGKQLYLQTGTESSIPASINVVYFSKYLVIDDDGTTRKEKPENDDDTFVLPTEWEPLLLDGLQMYILRKHKKYAEYRELKKIFDEGLMEMALKEPAKVSSALRGFKHYHLGL